MLGIGIQEMTPDIAASLGMKEPNGVLVRSVEPGGPADKAGLKTGDVILKLNGKNVNEGNSLRNQVAAMGPGADVTLTVLRDTAQQDIHVKLGELTPESAQATGQSGGDNGVGASKLGINVTPLTPELAQQLGLRRGTPGVAVQDVDPNGPAASAGLQEGDVIQEVNHQTIRSAADLKAAIQKSGNRPPLLLINRGGQTAFVSVPVE